MKGTKLTPTYVLSKGNEVVLVGAPVVPERAEKALSELKAAGFEVTEVWDEAHLPDVLRDIEEGI